MTPKGIGSRELRISIHERALDTTEHSKFAILAFLMALNLTAIKVTDDQKKGLVNWV
jgi:hypothetical protein